MKSREELASEFATNPEGAIAYALQLQEQLAQAQALIAELKQQIFGSKSEKLTPEQETQLAQVAGDLKDQEGRESNLAADVLEEALEKEAEERRNNAREKRRQRRNLPPVELKKEQVVLEPGDKLCPHTGLPRPEIGREVTTEYDFVPAQLIIRETIRPKYGGCGKGCCHGVAIAALPPRLLPQSLLGLGLAVHILLSRFDDHIAYYTLERNFAERFGVTIPRQQMVQWVEKIAHLLLIIYHRIFEDMAAGGYLQIDETPVKVLDPEVQGKAGKGWLWFYSAPEGDVFLDYHDSRSRAGPGEKLKHFKGTIQADGYEVYDALKRSRPLDLKRIGCLSHARRRFYKALLEKSLEALWFIARMRELYGIERSLKNCTAQERKRKRLEKAPALWLSMKRRAEEIQRRRGFLPQSTIGKAVKYLLNEYTALVGYLRDGRFRIDNNLVENDVRPSAVGRRRWLFIGHPDAGWRSAVIYTLIQSCRRRGINPQHYLTDILRRLPGMKASEAAQLTPSRWKPQPPHQP
jgi:transposase